VNGILRCRCNAGFTYVQGKCIGKWSSVGHYSKENL
jgi:hypothetical protein